MHVSIVVATLAACLTIAALFWKRPEPTLKPTLEVYVPDSAGSAGTVTVSSKIERHWSEWNGEYALYAHRSASLRNDVEFTRLHLLIPAFTYGSFSEAAAGRLSERARRFADDAGMVIEEESRFALFHARFHADRNALAIVPESLATPLGLNSAASLQRLALVRAPE